MKTIQVTLSVYAETADALTRAMECMSRAATGLALDDLDAVLMVGTEYMGEDGDEEGPQ